MNDNAMSYYIKQQAKNDLMNGIHKFSYGKSNNISNNNNKQIQTGINISNSWEKDTIYKKDKTKNEVTDKITNTGPYLNKTLRKNQNNPSNEFNTFNPITGLYGNSQFNSQSHRQSQVFTYTGKEKEKNLKNEYDDYILKTRGISKNHINNPNPTNSGYNNDENKNLSTFKPITSNDQKSNTSLNSKGQSNSVFSIKEFSIKEEPNKKYRDYMEDYSKGILNFCGNQFYSLFILCDGHGGKETSSYIVNRLPMVIENDLKELSMNEIDHKLVYKVLTDSFNKVDKEISTSFWSVYSGSTCNIILVIKNKDSCYVYSANCGDSRAVLYNPSKNFYERLSYDHKANDFDEIKRVNQSGGMVLYGRLLGQLAVSRAFGDFNLKNQGLIVSPFIKMKEISTSEIENYQVIVASDGVWDVLSDEEVLNIIKPNSKSAAQMSEIILNSALKNGSMDNISVISIRL